MILLAIDPGTRLGWALFEQGVLTAAGAQAHTCWHFPASTVVVIEEPTIYRNSRVDPNRIKKLELKVGELRREFKNRIVELVEPRTWKGQTPKDISHARAIAKLSPAERAIAGKYQSDKYDAIALGLWRLKR